MLRGIISAVVVLAVGILVFVTLFLAQGAKNDLRNEAKTNVSTAKEVIRLANRVNDYSLAYTASQVAERGALIHALRCPKNAKDAARREEPQIDPTTGKPVEASPKDKGDEKQELVCVDSQHALTLRLLKSYAQEMSPIWKENKVRFLSDRPLGVSIPREPDLFIVSDANGEIVARQGFDMADYYGPERPNMNEYEVVGRTEKLGVQHDVIVWKSYADSSKEEVIQVAAAPIRKNNSEGKDTYLGTVIVGYQLNNTQAMDLQDLLGGQDIIYFAANESGEINFRGNTLDRDPTFRAALDKQQFFELRSNGEISDTPVSLKEVARQGGGRLYQFEYDGRKYFTMPATFAEDRANSNTAAGFLVLTDVNRITRPLHTLFIVVPILGLILALLAALLIFYIIKLFLKPIDDIGAGVQEVIAGNKDYMWDVEDNYFSDLAHSLNIMSARLQGKPDPDTEEAAGSHNWGGMNNGGNQSARQTPSGNNKNSVVGMGKIRGRSAQKDDE